MRLIEGNETMIDSLASYRDLCRRNPTTEIGTSLFAQALVARHFGHINTDLPSHNRLLEKVYLKYENQHVDGRQALRLLK